MPKYVVHTHYDLAVLAEQFAEDIRVKHTDADLMEKEYLIVQTSGMKKWLALECARCNGVFTQAKILMPKQFIMDIGFKMLGLEEKRSVFERDVLPWALYSSIKDGIENGAEELDILKSYIGGENSEIKLFSLADKIADIFDQYMLYRHDWLEQWESGSSVFEDNAAVHDNEVWQRYLWNELIRSEAGSGVPSPAQYLKLLSEKIRSAKKEEIDRLPKRVSVFGLSILPPQYLNILARLGDLIDVTLYLQVPTIEYIDRGLSERQIQKRLHELSEAGKSVTNIPQTVNRLLRNFAPVSTDFMEMLLRMREDGVDPLYDHAALYEEELVTHSLLKRVQQDVLLCNVQNTDPMSVTEKEWSIRVAACHGPMREVEVLHDLLLDCFAADKTLSPTDILIVTPDVALYGPLVQMVFESAKEQSGAVIPVTISDQSALSDNADARFVRDMLSAVSGRFEASAVLSLFETVSQLSGEPVSLSERDQLMRWCSKSGIRWGYDQNSKKKYELPEDEFYTWRFGIDRLIAGMVMDDDAKMSTGLFPSAEVSGGGQMLLGRLAEFVHSLGYLAARNGESHTISTWNTILSSIVNGLMGTGDDQEENDNDTSDTVRRSLTAVRERAEISGVQKRNIPFAVYMQSVLDEIEQAGGTQGFHNGKATVAAMLPMRSIPFRVIAMLGMNHGLFPRRTGQPEFNLIRHDVPRIGDRDTLKGDRYLFLETILSAKDRLIITWSGFDPGDGVEVPPSNLVDELVSHLRREYSLTNNDGTTGNAGDAVLVKYPLHPFSIRYLSSLPNNFQLNTWNRSWFRNAGDHIEKRPLFEWELSASPVSAEKLLNGNRIYETLSDPMKAFLSACRIEQSRSEELIEDSEPFALDSLQDWVVREAILNEQLLKVPDVVEKLVANASIPPYAPGEMIVEEHRRTVQHRIERLRSIQQEPDFRSHRVDVTVDGIRYSMEMERISIKDESAVIIDLGRISSKRRLKLWITHLFLNIERRVTTSMVLLDGTIQIASMESHEAAAHLIKLHELYEHGSQKLLPFILEVSWTFIQPVSGRVKDPRSNAWKKLQSILNPSDAYSFSYDRNYSEAFSEAQNWDGAMKCIPGGEEVFNETAQTVFGPYIRLAKEQS